MMQVKLNDDVKSHENSIWRSGTYLLTNMFKRKASFSSSDHSIINYVLT